MRHNKAINHLGRQAGHRKALLANMACSLIQHKRITTTVAKAKALKSYRRSPTVRADTPACCTSVSVRVTPPRWR